MNKRMSQTPKSPDKTNREYVFEKIKEICNLQDNWDSYGASKTDKEKAKRAIELYNTIINCKPYVIPTKDGDIQFEWHANGFEIELATEELWVMDISILKEKETENKRLREALKDLEYILRGMKSTIEKSRPNKKAYPILNVLLNEIDAALDETKDIKDEPIM